MIATCSAVSKIIPRGRYKNNDTHEKMYTNKLFTNYNFKFNFLDDGEKILSTLSSRVTRGVNV